MKKLMISLTVIFFTITGTAQNAIKLPTGNYKAVNHNSTSKADLKATGKTFLDNKNVSYPVYITDKQKLFIIRTAVKSGKTYRMYLKL